MDCTNNEALSLSQTTVGSGSLISGGINEDNVSLHAITKQDAEVLIPLFDEVQAKGEVQAKDMECGMQDRRGKRKSNISEGTPKKQKLITDMFLPLRQKSDRDYDDGNGDNYKGGKGEKEKNEENNSSNEESGSDLNSDARDDQNTDSDDRPTEGFSPEKTMLRPVSIYKLSWNRLKQKFTKGEKSKTTPEEWILKIIDASKDSSEEKAYVYKKKKFLNTNVGNFKVLGFIFHTDTPSTWVKTLKHLNLSNLDMRNKSDIPVFVFQSTYNVDKDPDTYFLCSANTWTCFKDVADMTFCREIAKRFMEEKEIIMKKAMYIAGQTILEQKIYRDKQQLQGCNYNEVIINLKAKANSKLCDVIPSTPERKEPVIEMGQILIKIHRVMSFKAYADILETFSKAVKCPLLKQNAISKALDKIQLVSFGEEKKLNDDMNDKIIKDIQQNDTKNRNGFYLGHKLTEDWVSSFKVMLKLGKKTTTWTTPPSYTDLIKELIKMNQDTEDFLDRLRKGEVTLRFLMKSGKYSPSKNVLQYVHGSGEKDSQCYKVAGKWFRLNYNHCADVCKEFMQFAIERLLKERENEKLPLPWQTSVIPVKTSPTKIEKELFPSLTEEKREILFELKCSCVNEKTGISSVDGAKCKLLKSCNIYKELKKHLGSASDKKEQKTCLVKGQSSIDKYVGQQEKTTDAAEVKNNLLEVPSSFESYVSESTRRNKQRRRQNDSILPIEYSLMMSFKKQIQVREYLKKYMKNSQSDLLKILIKESPIVSNNGCVAFTNISKEILRELDGVSNEELLCFLRCNANLTEGEYNEMYLSVPEAFKGSYVVGDRIDSAKYPELFDILWHHDNKTYLYHVKEGFGQKTRDACSQIRIAANVIWNQQKDHIQWFWKQTTTYKGMDVYRLQLKERLLNQYRDETEFEKLFTEVDEIVFVYAFTAEKDLEEEIITERTFKDLEHHNTILKTLKDLEVIDFEGIVSVDFLSKRQVFLEAMKANGAKESVPIEAFKRIKKLIFSSSIIAKLEILTLRKVFNDYASRKGPGHPKQTLRICQIPSSLG